MPYTNGDGTYHDRRRCRRLHNTGNRIRRIDAIAGLEPCEYCGGESNPTEWTDRPAAALEAGICPWCDDYEGDHVGRHASAAHPDQWARYQS